MQEGARKMAVELNHTTVPAHDKEASAVFYKQLFGFEYQGPLGPFAPVQITDQHLTLDFYTGEQFERHHYAFKVSESEFDEIFERVKGSRPCLRQRTLDAGRWNDQPLERWSWRVFSRPKRTPARTSDTRLHRRAVSERLTRRLHARPAYRWCRDHRQRAPHAEPLQTVVPDPLNHDKCTALLFERYILDALRLCLNFVSTFH